MTTAPADLDGPSTMTLHAATLADVASLAADSIGFDSNRAAAPARLVLVDATELTWHRSRYREGQYIFASADPVLVGLKTLQHWLWQRLYRAPQTNEDRRATALSRTGKGDDHESSIGPA